MYQSKTKRMHIYDKIKNSHELEGPKIYYIFIFKSLINTDLNYKTSLLLERT